MKKKLLTLALALVLLVALVIPASVAMAAEGTVTCTVTGELIALTVDDGGVDYGVVAVSGTKNTALYEGTNNPNGSVTAQTQIITNTGSGAEDFNMQTTFADGATVDWALSVDTPGADVFTHGYLVSDVAYVAAAPIGTFTNWSVVDTYVLDAGGANVATSGIEYLELEIGMPTSSTDLGAHSIIVTIQAVAAD